MNGLDALLLGLIQGLTEFLPVSSSGHRVIFQELLGSRQPGLLFAIAVQLATLAAVLIFYRRRVARLARGALRRRPDALRYLAKLAVATLPAVVAVLALGDLLEARFESPKLAGFGLLLTGAILWTTRSTFAEAPLSEPGWVAALLIGCAQACAILPGLSRSGATVALALALGIAPAAAAEFSFLMSAIAIAGVAIRSLPDLLVISPEHAGALALGCAAALASGLAAIWGFVRLLRARGLHRFAYYTWAAGTLFLIWSWSRA